MSDPKTFDDDILDLQEVVSLGEKLPSVDAENVTDGTAPVLTNGESPKPPVLSFPDPTPETHVVDPHEELQLPSMADLDGLLGALGASVSDKKADPSEKTSRADLSLDKEDFDALPFLTTEQQSAEASQEKALADKVSLADPPKGEAEPVALGVKEAGPESTTKLVEQIEKHSGDLLTAVPSVPPDGLQQAPSAVPVQPSSPDQVPLSTSGRAVLDNHDVGEKGSLSPAEIDRLFNESAGAGNEKEKSLELSPGTRDSGESQEQLLPADSPQKVEVDGLIESEKKEPSAVPVDLEGLFDVPQESKSISTASADLPAGEAESVNKGLNALAPTNLSRPGTGVVPQTELVPAELAETELPAVPVDLDGLFEPATDQKKNAASVAAERGSGEPSGMLEAELELAQSPRPMSPAQDEELPEVQKTQVIDAFPVAAEQEESGSLSGQPLAGAPKSGLVSSFVEASLEMALPNSQVGEAGSEMPEKQLEGQMLAHEEPQRTADLQMDEEHFQKLDALLDDMLGPSPEKADGDQRRDVLLETNASLAETALRLEGFEKQLAVLQTACGSCLKELRLLQESPAAQFRASFMPSEEQWTRQEASLAQLQIAVAEQTRRLGLLEGDFARLQASMEKEAAKTAAAIIREELAKLSEHF